MLTWLIFAGPVTYVRQSVFVNVIIDIEILDNQDNFVANIET